MAKRGRTPLSTSSGHAKPKATSNLDLGISSTFRSTLTRSNLAKHCAQWRSPGGTVSAIR